MSTRKTSVFFLLSVLVFTAISSTADAVDCSRCSKPHCGWRANGAGTCQCQDEDCKCSVSAVCVQAYSERRKCALIYDPDRTGKCDPNLSAINCDTECDGRKPSTNAPTPVMTTKTPSPDKTEDPLKTDLPTRSPATTPVATDDKSINSKKGGSSSSSGLENWQMILIICCGVVFMLLVVIILWYCWRKASRDLDEDEINEADLAFYQENYNAAALNNNNNEAIGIRNNQSHLIKNEEGWSRPGNPSNRGSLEIPVATQLTMERDSNSKFHDTSPPTTVSVDINDSRPKDPVQQRANPDRLSIDSVEL